MLTVIGEALIDEVVSDSSAARAHVGGSPMNVAVGLARLGHPVQFLGRFGQDRYGSMIERHLRSNSVLVPLPADEAPTGVATAVLDSAGAATYTFDLEWSLPDLAARLPVLLEGTTLLHTGSIAAMLAPGAADVAAAVQRAHPRATISYDPNCRPAIIKDREFARAQAEKFVALSDIVKASDEDLEWLYPERTIAESARAWLAMGPAMVVVTRGGDGPWGVTAEGEAAARVPRVDVVDTVGAGDSFMAALLGAVVDRELDGSGRREALRRLPRSEFQSILTYAARAAAITVSRAGANPPSRREMEHGKAERRTP